MTDLRIENLSAALVLPVMTAWWLSEWLGHRRLKRFGNPAILGIRRRWLPRIAAALMFSTAIAAVAAILQVTEENPKTADPGTPDVFILLEPGRLSNRAHSARIWGDMVNIVGKVVGKGGDRRFSLWGPGTPPALLVPETCDPLGLLMMMERLALDWQGGDIISMRRAVHEVAGMPGFEPDRDSIIIITLRDPQDVVMQLGPLSTPPLNVLAASLAPSSGAAQPRFGIADADAAWIWSDGEDQLNHFLDRNELASAERERSPASGWMPMQFLALAAFSVLLLETLLPLVVPLTAGD